MTLTNFTYVGYDAVVAGDGVPSAGGGVVAIKGNGAIEFSSEAAGIDRRAQGEFVYEDCTTGAVVLELDAADLNLILTTNATWDTLNDRWNYKAAQTVVHENTTNGGFDIDMDLSFQTIQDHYVNHSLLGDAGDLTAVNHIELNDYFVEFVNDIKKNVLVNGGEVLFTDETLAGKEYTSNDLASTIRFATAGGGDLSASSPAVDVLGQAENATSGSGDTGTIVGSTDVQHTVDTLKVLEINKILRKMMDIGYNGRAASGSGDMEGSGYDGLFTENPFKAGDVLFFENGFAIDAKVQIDNELHEEENQLLDANGIASTGISASAQGVTYTKEKLSSNLFIVLSERA